MLDMFYLCQRPVTAHGCPRCPLWQPCAGTGRCHHWIIGTMAPWAHAHQVSFVESVSCCDTNTFPKTKTLLFHLTPYQKIRPRRSENRQDPGSPLPSDQFSVWACTSRNLWWRIAFLKVFLLSACTSRKDPRVDFTAILPGPRSLTKATLRYVYRLFC